MFKHVLKTKNDVLQSDGFLVRYSSKHQRWKKVNNLKKYPSIGICLIDFWAFFGLYLCPVSQSVFGLPQVSHS